MTPGVTAMIVNYNAGAELRQALQSIAADIGDAAVGSRGRGQRVHATAAPRSRWSSSPTRR